MKEWMNETREIYTENGWSREVKRLKKQLMHLEVSHRYRKQILLVKIEQYKALIAAGDVRIETLKRDIEHAEKKRDELWAERIAKAQATKSSP